jgi:hypothetical protein
MLKALDRHPVLATVLTGLGVTMLAAGLVGLLAPLTVLDGLWQLGDARLLLALGGFFIASLAAAGIAFAQRAVSARADETEEELEGDVEEAEVDEVITEDGEGPEGSAEQPAKGQKYFT